MRSKFATASAIVLVLLLALPVLAITYGEPDGNAHPYVGLVVFYDATGKPVWRCSGTLLTERIFLTAGHCTFGAARAQIWFSPEVTIEMGYPFKGGVRGVPISHPFFDDFASFPNTRDIGIVKLDRPVKMDTYGVLPTENLLDAMARRRGTQDVYFTVVGYGFQGVKPVEIKDRTRYRGTSILVNLNSALTDGFNVQFSSNTGIWSGGACFGDSGGPVFLNDTNIIASVNSFVLNLNCKGAYFGYRTDIFDAQQFLGEYIDLP